MQGPPQLYFTLLLWLILGAITSQVAKKRGRRPVVWFFIGAFFGLIGLLVLFLLPKVDSPQKEEELLPLPPPEESTLIQKNWYYLDATHQRVGPMGFSLLQEAWKTQKITEKSFVWTEGMGEWRRVEELSDLYNELITNSPL